MFSATLCVGDYLRAFPLKDKVATKVALCTKLHIANENFIAGWEIETLDSQSAYYWNIEADRDWLWNGTNEYLIITKDKGEKFKIEYFKFKMHPVYGTGFESDPFALTIDECSGLSKEYLHTLILEFIGNVHKAAPKLRVLEAVSCPQAIRRTK